MCDVCIRSEKVAIESGCI